MSLKQRSEEDGFTLAEMLVALAILALMSTYAIMSITTLNQVKRVEQKIDASSEVDAVQRHLQHTIADTRSIFALDAENLARLAFVGKPDTLEIVAPLNDRLERGGLYRLRYGFDPGSRQMTLGYALFRPVPVQSNLASEPLLTNVENLTFRYYGYDSSDESGEWTSAWERTDILPSAIEISARFPEGSGKVWHPLVIRIAGE
jgi:general secretion pathway protein J